MDTPAGQDDHLEGLPVLSKLLGDDKDARRAANMLWRAGIRSPLAVYETPLSDLADVKQLGPVGLERIKEARRQKIDFHAAHLPGHRTIDYGRVVEFMESLAVQAQNAPGLSADEQLYVAGIMRNIADSHRVGGPL